MVTPTKEAYPETLIRWPQTLCFEKKKNFQEAREILFIPAISAALANKVLGS